MYKYICTYAYIYIYIYTRIHIYIYTYIFMEVRTIHTHQPLTRCLSGVYISSSPCLPSVGQALRDSERRRGEAAPVTSLLT